MAFASFLFRRLAGAAVTLVTIVVLTFVFFWSIPAQPARFLYPGSTQLTNADVQQARQVFGLDRPKPVQVVSYLANLVRGDFGRGWAGTRLVGGSLERGAPVRPGLFRPVRVTLSIVLGGAVLVLLLSIPLGAFAGTRIGTWADRLISFGALLGVCSHPMVLGLILRSAAHGVHWSATSGYCPLIRGATDPCGGVRAWSEHLALPWLTFALLFLALYTRIVRASVAETLDEDFVRTARAKGAGEMRVVAWHVLPYGALRVLTMIGMEIGTALGVCVYIESAFGFDGLGRLAVFVMGGNSPALDLPVLLGIVTVITLIVVVGNAAVDLLYAAFDPRVTQGAPGTRTKSLVGGVF